MYFKFPKTIGNGPMITTPPPSTFLPLKPSSKPNRTKAKPKIIKRKANSNNLPP